MPSLTGAIAWLNSPPLTTGGLKGKVVLVDFWTYSCINCLRALPYIRAWNETYKDQGLVLIGIYARDLHLVLGPAAERGPIRFRVTINSAPSGSNHGADKDADGRGSVTGQRLYQLVRQDGTIGDHTFEIQFLYPGAQAYAFTFG